MRLTRVTLIVLFALLTSLITAQTPANAPRLTSPIIESQLVTLQGNVPVQAQAQFDQGAVTPATVMSHMRLVLSRTPAQKAALDAYMAEQQNPNSPNYHKWLTPAVFGQLYGANPEDIKIISGWLQSRGFSIERVDSGQMSIAFSGTVDQVENAFHTQIHQFSVNGESFYSNITDPKIPTALTPVVAGVTRLNNIHPKPANERANSAKYDITEHKFTPIATDGVPSPELTTGCPSCFLYVTPQDAATIYNSPSATLNLNYSSGTTYDGTGINIGIGGDALIKGATFWNYRNLFLGQTIPAADPPTTEPCGPSVSACSGSVAVQKQGNLTIFNIDSVTANGDTDEAYIDTEFSGGLAPGANVYFYTSTDLWSAIEQMLYDNTVNTFSLSFGSCEASQGSFNQQISNWWQQAAAQGIAVFVSTGDSGSAGCDYNVQVSSGGLAVNGLASTPYNVAVGGTDYIALLTSFSTYVSQTNTALYGSAKSFIPESTWNDSTTVNNTYNNNVTSGNGATGGSGGISSCATTPGGVCTGYPKPSWQTGPGVPADGVRDIPDVSLFAANGYYGATWATCTDDSAGGGHFTNCVLSGGTFYLAGFGGTSTSSPATAGIFALVSQAAGGSVGLPNLKLYSLAAGSHGSSIFFDTTVGNNSVPCSGPTGECISYAGGHFLDGYNTGTGYDLATGLGSLNITNLISEWSSVLPQSSIVITPSAYSINVNQPLTVGVSVNGESVDGGAPTGNVTLTISTYNGGTQALVTASESGTTSFSVPANSLPVGTDTVTVSYAGDGNYAAGSGSVTINVTKTTPTITWGAIPASMNQSATLPVVVTVNAAGGLGTPTGTITLTSGTYNSGAQAINGSGVLNYTIPAYSLPIGNDVITATYSGDTNYGTANGNSTSINVIGGTYTIGATAVTVTAGATTNNTSTITITPSGGYAGTVTWTAAVQSSVPSNPPSPPTFTSSAGLVFTSGSSAAQSGTVTVNTVTNSAIKAPPSGPLTHAGLVKTGWFTAAGGSILASFLLFLVPRSRKWRNMMMALLMVCAVGFVIIGCGSSSTPPASPSVMVTPSKASFAINTAVSFQVTVSAPAGDSKVPTGTVSLSGAGSNAITGTLANGVATINAPAGTFTATGAQTIYVSYAGDLNFTSATGNAPVTINPAGTTTGTYVIKVTAVGTDPATTTKSTTFNLTVN